MKKCFKCGCEKPLSEFYKHNQMADGHVNKCKECNKNDVATHRAENIEKIREYDRKRGNRQSYSYRKDYRDKYPKKCKAHAIVRRNIKNRNLYKEPCEICGNTKVVAHHDDYDKPLNVRWLCQAHHKQWHAKHGEGLNAK